MSNNKIMIYALDLNEYEEIKNEENVTELAIKKALSNDIDQPYCTLPEFLESLNNGDINSDDFYFFSNYPDCVPIVIKESDLSLSNVLGKED